MRRVHLTTKGIYKSIAKQANLTVAQVEEIVQSQFAFVTQTMAEGVKNNPDTFKSIQLTHLGKFAVRKHKLEDYKEKYDRNRK